VSGCLGVSPRKGGSNDGTLVLFFQLCHRTLDLLFPGGVETNMIYQIPKFVPITFNGIGTLGTASDSDRNRSVLTSIINLSGIARLSHSRYQTTHSDA
jgi:hypothetical protein